MNTDLHTSPDVTSSTGRAPTGRASTRGALARLLLAAALATALLPAAAQDDVASMPTATTADSGFDATAGARPSAPALAPGEYLWTPEAAPAGPLVVVVSLPEQRAHVYRNGVRIGLSTISSGKPGKETPTGTFPILQKKRDHRSNLYNNAPMPFMQRLTWDGIALHAGRIPGYPASHGCVRLPHAFAEQLFQATEHGSVVVVADEASHGMAVAFPGERAPVDAYTGMALATPPQGVTAAVATAPASTPSPSPSVATRQPDADPARRLPAEHATVSRAGWATASLE